jgi:putative translation initiation factor aIF-2 beta subunit
MEEYTDLLNKAFEKVKQQETCERFEIRKADWHVQGKKTIINNFMQISNCLREGDSDNFAKFLSKELATLSERDGDRLILNKAINSQTIIDEKIREYAEFYIICQKCKKPDTHEIEENGKKFIRCMACGFRKQI